MRDFAKSLASGTLALILASSLVACANQGTTQEETVEEAPEAVEVVASASNDDKDEAADETTTEESAEEATEQADRGPTVYTQTIAGHEVSFQIPEYWEGRVEQVNYRTEEGMEIYPLGQEAPYLIQLLPADKYPPTDNDWMSDNVPINNLASLEIYTVGAGESTYGIYRSNLGSIRVNTSSIPAYYKGIVWHGLSEEALSVAKELIVMGGEEVDWQFLDNEQNLLRAIAMNITIDGQENITPAQEAADSSASQAEWYEDNYIRVQLPVAQTVTVEAFGDVHSQTGYTIGFNYLPEGGSRFIEDIFTVIDGEYSVASGGSFGLVGQTSEGYNVYLYTPAEDHYDYYLQSLEVK